jgi:hypothetical protein
MPMPARRLLLATLVAIASTVSLALAEPGRPASSQGAAAAPAPAATAPPEIAAPPSNETAAVAPARPRRPVNPLYAGITALIEAEGEQLRVLARRLDATRDSEAAMAIQREIEQVKVQTELSILRLQSEHARRSGKAALADRLDAAIREMQEPRPAPKPASRPAPGATTTPTPR